MKQITAEQIFAARTKAFQNALELYEDAIILYESNKWARAFFLIQIATEELGKYGILATSTISALHGSLDWKHFWKRLRDHKNKTQHILLFEDFHNFLNDNSDKPIFSEENKKYAFLQENIKMRSLYSDVSQNGQSSKPSEVITQELCDLALKLLKNRINLVESFENEVATKIPIDKLTKQSIQEFYEEIGLKPLLDDKD